MGEENGAGVAAFDGNIRSWPTDQAIQVLGVPKNKNDFIIYMACEIFKNQLIKNPKAQADEAINNAKCLYSALSGKGLL